MSSFAASTFILCVFYHKLLEPQEQMGGVTYTAMYESCHSNSSTDMWNCERGWFAVYQIFSWVEELHVSCKDENDPMVPVAHIHPNSSVNMPATKKNLCLTLTFDTVLHR